MATQRLSNVLSHITPGSKSPLEQMYAPTFPSLPFNSPLLPQTLLYRLHMAKHVADRASPTVPLRTPMMLSSLSPSGLP